MEGERGDKGDIYLCSWKRIGKKYKIWLKEHPEIVVEGFSFQEAEEDMLDALMCHYGDGDAVLDYDRTMPKNYRIPSKYSIPALVTIHCNGIARLSSDNKKLFTGDRCDKCGKQYGRRTNAELYMGEIDTHFDGCFIHEHPYQIFSSKFLSYFTEDEKKNFEIRKINYSNSIKTFFELIGKPVAEWIGVRDLSVNYMNKCAACGRFLFDYMASNNHLISFVAESDLPKPIPDIFFIDAYSQDICMKAKRWRSIQGNKGTKGVTSVPIGIVKDEDVVRPEALVQLWVEREERKKQEEKERKAKYPWIKERYK